MYAELTDYERKTDLVSVHKDTMSVSEMAAMVEFAATMARHNDGVVFSGTSLRRDKTWKELKAQVTDKAYYRSR